MSVTELRQRQATLEAVRLDLPRWPLGPSASAVPVDRRPVVAVDWSEIFSYLTQTRPRYDRGEVFAMHYAGLNYLLFRLPCRLVLLPPYVAEMEHFIGMVKAHALSFGLPDRRKLAEKYSALVDKIANLQKKYEPFSAVLEGDWSATEKLPPEAWQLLDELLKEHLPSLFFDVQEKTAEILTSLRALREAKDDSGKRLLSLEALHVLPKAAGMRSIEGWQHWMAEMSAQRPSYERQNRADALALAYLQALHQAFGWRNVPVYFASRSLSMLHVMEDHSGEFEPYVNSNGDAGRMSRSSWRSWDYFAELGYYSTWSAREDDGDGAAALARIERDLTKREDKINQKILNAERDRGEASALDVAEFFADWETLRGSFDLEGLGGQEHWEKLRRSPKERSLVNLLESVLSAEDAGTFLRRRGELAERILGEIEAILGSLSPEALSWPRKAPRENLYEETTLTEIVTSHLNIATLFEDYLRKTLRILRADTVGRTVALVRHLIDAADDDTRAAAAHNLLHFLTGDAKQMLNQASRDWLAGIAFYFEGLFSESVSYLAPWLATHSSSASSGFGLATRALCAEAHRQNRDHELGMAVLQGVQQERLAAMSASEALVWHCLKGQLMLDWMKRAKEDFELFPKPGGRRSEGEVIVPMVEPVAAFVSTRKMIARDLQLRAANILLYLAGRHIPENVPDLVDDKAELQRRLGWFLDRKPAFADIEQWLRAESEATPEAPLLHTLGYYNWKLFLLTRSAERRQDALGYFKHAKRLAELSHNERIERLIAEHLEWASETSRVA